MAENDTQKVIAFDPTNGLAIEATAIDESAGIIRGVSIATANVEAIGHGEEDENGVYREFVTDDQTLVEMLTAIQEIGQPLKAKLEHGSGLEDIVGEFRNFRITGEHLRADFYAYEASKHRNLLFTFAKNLSKQFGVSVTAILRKVRAGAVDVMRVQEILSADFVDEPAINAALFSRKKTNLKNNMEKEEMTKAIAAAMEPQSELMQQLEERLAKLEGSYKSMSETEESSEMSKALSVQSEMLAKLDARLMEMHAEQKKLGLEAGASHSEEMSKEEPKEEEKTFEGELAKKISEGKNKAIAYGELCAEQMPLMQKEAKKRGIQVFQLLNTKD